MIPMRAGKCFQSMRNTRPGHRVGECMGPGRNVGEFVFGAVLYEDALEL